MTAAHEEGRPLAGAALVNLDDQATTTAPDLSASVRAHVEACAHSALAYGERGWAPIRVHGLVPAKGDACSCGESAECKSTGKHPADKGWATSDRTPEQIASLLRARTWAATNVGIRTGPVSGLLVLDVDPDNGGDATLADLLAEHGDLPTTYTVRTGSGGTHYYFAHPDDGVVLRNTAGSALGKGLDTRGRGGMVVAAPSVSGKGAYTVGVDAPVADLPAWLLDRLTAKRASPTTSSCDAAPISDGWTRAAVEGCLARLDAMGEAATDDGAGYDGEAWNATTYKVALRLVEVSNGNPEAYPRDRARADLLAHAPTDDGFGLDVVEDQWDRAVEYVADRAARPALRVVEGSTPAPTTPPEEIDGEALLDTVREHFARYVKTVGEHDLDLLTLWAVHTHLVEQTWTTPRLVLDSPVPGSGKTTVLEHLHRLTLRPVQMASVSSPALLVRMLANGPRTMLIDEADRTLSPDHEGIGDLLSVLNSGYKKGGTRPTLVPDGDGGWVEKELPTYAPVVMAGNNPNLPEDTRQRCIRVLLMPDLHDTVDESDWEMIEAGVKALGDRIAAWAEQNRDRVAAYRPPLPEGVKGRNRERWSPLKRVAHAASERWSALVDVMALADLDAQQQDREDGLMAERPHIALLRHMLEVFDAHGAEFLPTDELLRGLIASHPEAWSAVSPYGKALTSQRMGRMLVQSYKVNSQRQTARGPRGYRRATLQVVAERLGLVAQPVVERASSDDVAPFNGSAF